MTRDGIANRIANFALNHIATKIYRDRLAMVYGLGMVALQDRANEEAGRGA